MDDWATISALATAAGTLALAIATFVSVRSSNRSARVAERALQAGIRPPLSGSRLVDPDIKIGWSDDHRAVVGGGRASIELMDDRMEAARRQLLDGLPVTRVATDVGFHDQAHFTHHFRRHVGTTPGRFLARPR